MERVIPSSVRQEIENVHAMNSIQTFEEIERAHAEERAETARLSAIRAVSFSWKRRF